jgi:hypothetical protein
MDKIGIWNIALGNIGISKFVSSPDEQSNEARTCRIFYDQALNRALEESPWNFARSYVDLQDIGSPPAKWAYRYRYPADCVFARAVTPRGVFPQVCDYFSAALLRYINRDNFEIIEDEANNGLAICCNIPEAMLTFTKRITKINLFSALFIDTVGWSLAKDIASPLSATAGMAQAAAVAYNNAMLKAAAKSLNEGKETLERESEFVTARL